MAFRWHYLNKNLYLSRAERREAMHEYAGYTLSDRMVEEFHLLDASVYSSVSEGRAARRQYIVENWFSCGRGSPGRSAI